MSAGGPVSGDLSGRYRILEQIGAGGMGVVFRARDERLARDVAIKMFPERLLTEADRQRFQNEALALSQLNHPNIATVHDFDDQDKPYLVMEWIPGVTLDAELLRGPLSSNRLLSMATQLAAGIAAAHERNIVHRDLKPANLRITADGRLKILDFGLAKLVQPLGDSAATQSAAVIAGTLPYMAPEQVRGEAADHRSDIWAAGAILYEAATGRRPFHQPGRAELLSAILHQTPQRPLEFNSAIPPAIDQVIMKALDKDPARRYQSARELLVDLQRIASPTTASELAHAPTRRRSWVWAAVAGAVLVALLAVGAIFRFDSSEAAHSIAVLPLANESGDPEHDFLADGITEGLISSVSQIPNSQVMARNTVFRYRGKNPDAMTVGEELNVARVVMGRLRVRADSLSIYAELVDTRRGTQVWGKQYQGSTGDLVSLQNQISADLSRALEARVDSAQTALSSPGSTSNSEAYALYLRGRFHHEKWTRGDAQRALELYREALGKDPNFALAYAGMAATYAFPYSGLSAPERARLARAAAERALELEPELGEAEATLATLAMDEWNFADAERRFRRALELNPNHAEARHQYSHFLIVMGRMAESEAQSRLGLELDPLSSAMQLHLAYHYLVNRQYDQAEPLYRKLIAKDPSYAAAHLQLSTLLQHTGRPREAIESYLRYLAMTGRDESQVAAARAAAESGGLRGIYRGLVARWLQDPTPDNYVNLAAGYSVLGEKDKAFEWLERAFKERHPALLLLGEDRDFDGIRSDPRYRDLRRRIGLPVQ